MLKLYYARPSAYARPVWLALLEKQLPFELIPVNLGGAQFDSAFLAINPFSHIPVLVDGDFRIIESLAILDYLEAQYPERSLLPSDPKSLAKARMVQLVALNELLPTIFRLVAHDKASIEHEYARLKAMNALSFLESLLGDSLYFAGEQLTLAEIVAGTLVPLVTGLGVNLADYPRLHTWSTQLLLRPSWQQISLSPQEWVEHKRRMRVIPKLWERRRRERMKVLSQDLVKGAGEGLGAAAEA